MRVINVMWSGGAAYTSVLKVHQQLLNQLGPQAPVTTWLLQGEAGAEQQAGVHLWHMSSAQLKGRGFWRLLKRWTQAKLSRALSHQDEQIILMDGFGVARVMLPIVKKSPKLRAVIMVHGTTRISRSDLDLLHCIPRERLSIVAVSATLAEEVQQSLPFPVRAMRCAVEPKAYISQLLSRQEARSQLGLPQDDTPVIGAVGRLVDTKGFSCLIEAYSRALSQQPRLRLVILGEGSQRRQLQMLIEQHGLLGKVLLPGHVPHVTQLYRAFDWVAIPSEQEGLGLILQEAVIASVPVIASDLPVFVEQLGVAGHYVPINDCAAWAEAICTALGRSALTVAKQQYLALAPEQSWQNFQQTAKALLGPRQ
ncbi:glycosyltransferase [Pseudomonas sp. 5P_3.1_Bac2]|uniref:glycosyltransferase n=1 Tax=Pseudomonas sp. 5P_3.1_Bac2 TaxID=2971617 RepID=UPI0021C5BDA2|nr:glycosyltransferase [Pseudomonas sp. 5P_3.1_Bac2]MCU1718333.1 glycosyltransferase [Pseudomonas sp. 5P_3.1_Bac2]